MHYENRFLGTFRGHSKRPIKDVLTQYRDEACVLETSLSGTKRHIVAQQIMLHNIITRRELS